MAARPAAVVSYIVGIRPVQDRFILGLREYFLYDMGAPPCYPGDREHGGHKVAGDADHMVDRGTEKIDIRFEQCLAPPREFRQRSLFDLRSQLIPP